MEKMILDTSVLVKFFAPDEKDQTVDDLLMKFYQKKLLLVTLDIAIYELANTLKLSKRTSVEVVSGNIAAIFEMEPQIIKLSQELIKNGLIIMSKVSLTIYDSVFIAAAEMERLPLLTADYKHHKKEISKQILPYREWRV